jgi:hypothetical protein
VIISGPASKKTAGIPWLPPEHVLGSPKQTIGVDESGVDGHWSTSLVARPLRMSVTLVSSSCAAAEGEPKPNHGLRAPAYRRRINFAKCDNSTLDLIAFCDKIQLKGFEDDNRKPQSYR